MVRALLAEKTTRAQPELFCQLIKPEAEVVLSILKNLQLI